MRILIKSKLGFRNPQTQEILCPPCGSVVDVPEWVEKNPLFAMALRAGSLILIDTPSEERKPEQKKAKKK